MTINLTGLGWTVASGALGFLLGVGCMAVLMVLLARMEQRKQQRAHYLATVEQRELQP